MLHDESSRPESKLERSERRLSEVEQNARALLTNLDAFGALGCLALSDPERLQLGKRIAKELGIREDVLVARLAAIRTSEKTLRESLRPAPARQGSLLDRAVTVKAPRAGILK